MATLTTLEKLVLTHLTITKLPEFLPKRLKVLSLPECKRLRDISVLSALPNLEVVGFFRCFSLKDATVLYSLKKLKEISFEECTNLSIMPNLADTTVFPCLERVILSGSKPGRDQSGKDYWGDIWKCEGEEEKFQRTLKEIFGSKIPGVKIIPPLIGVKTVQLPLQAALTLLKSKLLELAESLIHK